MPKGYDHREIEKRAQEKWAALDLYTTDLTDAEKEPYYLLFEFPYPSGDLHMGHWYAFAVTDIYARYLRTKGKNVLLPIGFDAFGLPAENAAMKNGADPKAWTYENMEHMRTQIRSMGTSVDWSKEIITSEPSYYKWTQWLFAKLFEHKLAERREAPVKWCPKDRTVLANEQVIDGRCERCGTEVVEKRLTQWFLKITDYAERLLNDLDALPWKEDIKDAQRAWIGKSEGAKLTFPMRVNGAKRILLLHGKGGSSKDDFHPWLKSELEARGYEVEAPDLPNPSEPDDEEQADFVQTNCHIDESTIIFGHSFGGIVALRLLERGVKAAGAVFAAAPMSGTFLDGKERPSVTAACKKGFKWDRIKENAKLLTVLFDIGDDVVPQTDGDMLAEGLGVPIIRVNASEGHFNGKKEPALLTALAPAIEVFTTRPDTVFGVTYVVLAPEHPLVKELSPTNAKEVSAYVEATAKKTERERSENKDKSGVRLEGVMAVNPANQEKIPIYVADYVLGSYGTGAVMAVPAHDERDFEFAQKHSLPIRRVIEPKFIGIGEAAPKEGEEFQKREAAIAVVKNPKDDTYLCSSWKEHLMHGLITGGIEDGEDPVLAAKREVLEETGYKNLRHIERPEITMNTFFYHRQKKLNRHAHFHYIFFELENEDRDPITNEENAKHEFLWKKPGELKDFFTVPDGKYVVDFLDTPEYCYMGDGVLMNSGEFSGRDNREAMWDIVRAAEGERVTQYRMRDWLVSRQRYWGCPIPVVYDPMGKPHLVPPEHLPWLLPTDVDFAPADKAPLSTSKELHERVTKIFGEGWTPEYDTLDTFVDSSWYFLRYLDPKDDHDFSDASLMKKWLPVDRYSGGTEHTTMHLLYSRFFHKALYDLALVPTSEPFNERFNRGLIMGPDGQKMSKRWGNVINPDDVVKESGTDAVRLYLAFIGPYNEAGHYPWNPDGVAAMRKFLERVVALSDVLSDDAVGDEVSRMLAKAEAKSANDSERFKFNTALSALMVLVRDFESLTNVPKAAYKDLLIMLAPFAPHITEELWDRSGGEGSIHQAMRPAYDASLLTEDTVTLAVQVNGKRRGDVRVSPEATQDEVLHEALQIPAVAAALGGNPPLRVVYVAGKVLNLVV